MKLFLGVLSAAAAAVCYSESSDFWRTQTIYQVLTDRFSLPPGSPQTACDDLSTYCGGTFSGISSKIDFITEMGFSAVWISPIPPNTPNGYHGYWAKCLVTEPVNGCTVLNQNFGTDEDLDHMITAGKDAGVSFMLDVVGNHMGGTINDISGFYPFNTSASYHNCNGCPADCNIANFQDQETVQHCRLSGLPDLNQTNPEVASSLQTWVQFVMNRYKFAGLRVDTVPEVNKPFWQQFQAAAGTFTVGEVFNGDTQYVSSFQGSALGSLLSYPMFFTLRNVFAQKQTMYLLQTATRQYESSFKDTSVLGTFVDNHDNDRFLNVQSDWTLYSNALTWTLMARGIPIIYYGTAFGFDGGNDPANREALWPAGYNITNAPLGQLVKTLNSVRKENNIVGGLQQVQRYADDSFYAFTRGSGISDASSVFVAMTNVGSGGQPVTRPITYQPYADGTVLCNALSSDAATAVWGVAGRSQAGSSTLLDMVAAAGQAANAVDTTGTKRTVVRVAAAARATQAAVRQLRQQAGAPAGGDCVTVSGGQFQVTLVAGQPKVYIPQSSSVLK